MSQDIIADTLNQIINVKKARKNSVVVARHSKLLLNLLEVARKYGYIKEYELNKEKKLEIKIGKLNKCQAIKPRYYVKVEEIEKYVKRYLPARDFGIIVISTNKGLVTDKEEEKIGGSLIAYFY